MTPSYSVYHPFHLFAIISVVHCLCYIPKSPPAFTFSFMTLVLSGVTCVVPYSPLMAGCLLAIFFVVTTIAFMLKNPMTSWRQVSYFCVTLTSYMSVLFLPLKLIINMEPLHTFWTQAWLILKEDIERSMQVSGSFQTLCYLTILLYLLLIGILIKTKTINQLTSQPYRLMIFASLLLIMTASFYTLCLLHTS